MSDNNNNQVQDGNIVTIHYTGRFRDGTQFDTSHERGQPLTTTVGSGELIAGFNNALVGMNEGENKTVTILADDAYGERMPEAVTTLERTAFPEDFTLEPGMPVPLMNENGEHLMATITEVTDESVTADLNHPLAGEDLIFEIEVLTVEGN